MSDGMYVLWRSVLVVLGCCVHILVFYEFPSGVLAMFITRVKMSLLKLQAWTRKVLPTAETLT